MQKIIFSALSNRTRVDILRALQAGGEMTVTELMDRLKLKQAFVSQSLRRLGAAGLVTSRSEGRFHYFSLNNPLAEAVLRPIDRYAGGIGKKYQKELSSIEKQIARFLSVLPDAVMVLPVGASRYSYVNPAAVRMLRARSERQMLSADIMRTVPMPLKASAKHLLAGLARGVVVPLRRTELRRFDGTAMEADVTAAPIVMQGRRAIIIVARDVSTPPSGRNG